ncbi:MAG: hypothetical protein IJ055_09235 [Oscillospiraceae bacterium]|nr:hypothetical protein [Oscillospiraceae bacterium]
MPLSSLTFTVLTLPVLLLLYYCIPEKGKQWYLLAGSLVIYGWGSPVRVLYPAAFLFFDFGVGLLLERHARKRTLCTVLLALSAVTQTAAMALIRYAAFLNGRTFFPFGIAVYSLQGLAYLIGVYRKRHPAAVRIQDLALYLFLFPVLYAGPLMNYVEFSEQLGKRRTNIIGLSEGLGIFIRGLAEKVILADTFGFLFRELRQTPTGSMSMLTAWLTTIAFSLYLYFELMGYAEMARGIGKCFGFELPRNFSHPFFCPGITAFMQSWNITVLLWFQTNFRHFLLGGAQKKWQSYAGQVLTWVLIGAWYGMRLQFLLWGLCIGLLLVFEQTVLERYIRRHYIFGVLYALITVQFSWVLFYTGSLGEAGQYWRAMLGFGAGLADRSGIYFLTSYAAILLLGLYTATDLFRNITERLATTRVGQGMQILTPVIHAGLLIFCLGSMLYTDREPMLWLLL